MMYNVLFFIYIDELYCAYISEFMPFNIIIVVECLEFGERSGVIRENLVKYWSTTLTIKTLKFKYF